MNWAGVLELSDELRRSIESGDLDAAVRVFDLLCDLRAIARGRNQRGVRGQYDPDDFDADELGLDPEEDFDA